MKILNSETYSAVPCAFVPCQWKYWIQRHTVPCLVNENTECKDIQCCALCLRALSMKILNSETYSALPPCLVNENTEYKDIQCRDAVPLCLVDENTEFGDIQCRAFMPWEWKYWIQRLQCRAAVPSCLGNENTEFRDYSAVPPCLRALSMKILNSETTVPCPVPSGLLNENTEFRDIQCRAAVPRQWKYWIQRHSVPCLHACQWKYWIQRHTVPCRQPWQWKYWFFSIMSEFIELITGLHAYSV